MGYEQAGPAVMRTAERLNARRREMDHVMDEGEPNLAFIPSQG